VFSTAGDTFAAAFASPLDAVQAALAVQEALAVEAWPTSTAVRVRIGLHTGTSDERDGDYFGPTLNRAARIMGAAGGGEVLASAATFELARDLGRVGIGFADSVSSTWPASVSSGSSASQLPARSRRSRPAAAPVPRRRGCRRWRTASSAETWRSSSWSRRCLPAGS
jgi:class 3 adenylate cyclase